MFIEDPRTGDRVSIDSLFRMKRSQYLLQILRGQHWMEMLMFFLQEVFL